MRIARILPLAGLLALPLRAQESALDARLVYSGYGTPSVEISKPAYVALFEVTASGVMQLYPSRTSQLHQLMGAGRTFFSPQDMAFVERINQGFMYDPFSQLLFASAYSNYSQSVYSPYGSGWASSGYNNSIGRRGLFLVVSTEPLELGAPISTQVRLNRTLYAMGHHFDLNVSSGLEALTALVASSNPAAEIATDFVPVLETYQSMADGLYDGYGTYLTGCGRFGAVPVIDAWRYGAMCPAGVIVLAPPSGTGAPTTPGGPWTPRKPVPVECAGCGIENGPGNVARLGGSDGTTATSSDGAKITDPERIRSFLADLRSPAPTPAMSGSGPGGAGGPAAARGPAGGDQRAPAIGGATGTQERTPAPSAGDGSARAPAPVSAPRASSPRNEQPRVEPTGARRASPVVAASPRAAATPASSSASSGSAQSAHTSSRKP